MSEANEEESATVELAETAIAEVAPDRAGDLETVDPDADVWSALDLDSLDHLAVMTRLADELAIDIPERDYPRLLSLRQLRAYVAAHAAPHPPG